MKQMKCKNGFASRNHSVQKRFHGMSLSPEDSVD